MLGRQLLRRDTYDGMTEQAWNQLQAMAHSAGGAARRAKRQTAQLVGGTSGLADEARARASAAYDALTGRRRTPWTWLIGAAAAGVGIGWLAATALRAAISPNHAETQSPRLEYVDAEPVQADGSRSAEAHRPV